MIFASRCNISEKLFKLAAQKPGYEYELNDAANKLDTAIGLYCLERDNHDNMARLLLMWGNAHHVYREAGGGEWKAD